jgi:hypothetical protein
VEVANLRRSSWVALGLILILFLGLVGTRLMHTEQISDEEQIHALLDKAKSSVEAKDVGGALSCVSENYSDDSGNTFQALRLLAIRGLRTPGRVDLVMEGTSVSIDGKSASVETKLTVSEATSAAETRELFSGRLKMALAKEDSRKWLIFPTSEWKIVGISGLPSFGSM